MMMKKVENKIIENLNKNFNAKNLKNIFPKFSSYYDLYPKNNEDKMKFGITKNVNYIDIKSFNVSFLIFFQDLLFDDDITDELEFLLNTEKKERVILFGKFLKSLDKNDRVLLLKLMIAFRNKIFQEAIKNIEYNILEINLDDIHFALKSIKKENLINFIPEEFLLNENLKFEYKKFKYILKLPPKIKIYFNEDLEIIKTRGIKVVNDKEKTLYTIILEYLKNDLSYIDFINELKNNHLTLSKEYFFYLEYIKNLEKRN